jgi:hypothetical protein
MADNWVTTGTQCSMFIQQRRLSTLVQWRRSAAEGMHTPCRVYEDSCSLIYVLVVR